MATKKTKTSTSVKPPKYPQGLPRRASEMNAAQRYASLEGHRWPYWQRAREAAHLTIPYIMPPIGTTEATELDTPYQSVAARGVNNLAAKLLLALFPPGQSFFRLTMDDFVKDKLAKELPPDPDGADPRTVFEEALGKVENAVINRLEQAGSRSTFYEALRHLIVAGNVLLEEYEKGKYKLYHLPSYVVQRDPQGSPIDIVIKQCLSRAALPDEIEAVISETEQAEDVEQTDKSADRTIDVFTRCRLVGKQWEIYQEVAGKRIPGTEATEPKDECSFMPLRWNRLDGENYGRGLVEEHLGDIRFVESGSQSIIDFAAAIARILIFVDEGGVTQKKNVGKARNGSVVDGKASDVSVLQLEKSADFQVLESVMERVEKRLEASFLMYAGAQRDAERVTAEEVRLVASELEQALGGMYSLLANEMQLPIVRRTMAVMQKEKALPFLPKDAVAPKIITGLAAIGRSSDLDKIQQLLKVIGDAFTPAVAAQYFSVSETIRRAATALGIDLDKMAKSDVQVQQATAQQNTQSMAEKLGPSVIGAMSDQAKAAQQNGQAPVQGAQPQQAQPAPQR